LIVSVISIITFFLYPVAPPWYYIENGFSNPLTEVHANSAQLGDVDDYLGLNIFTLMYSFESNPFAAFPSLHVSYPILTALIWKDIKPKRSYLMWIFPIGVALSAIYLNHHWVTDVLAGLIYTLISYKIAQIIVKKIIIKEESQD
jgi:membrane-associated phospholipid phosphatase